MKKQDLFEEKFSKMEEQLSEGKSTLDDRKLKKELDELIDMDSWDKPDEKRYEEITDYFRKKSMNEKSDFNVGDYVRSKKLVNGSIITFHIDKIKGSKIYSDGFEFNMKDFK